MVFLGRREVSVSETLDGRVFDSICGVRGNAFGHFRPGIAAVYLRESTGVVKKHEQRLNESRGTLSVHNLPNSYCNPNRTDFQIPFEVRSGTPAQN